MADVSLDLLELGGNSLDAGAKRLEITFVCDGDRAILTVADDGEGMDRSTALRACEKGFSTKGSDGLGLYKVSGGAKSVCINSAEGGGTKITVEYDANGLTAGLLGDTAVALASDAELKLSFDACGEKLALYTRDFKKHESERLSTTELCKIKSLLNRYANAILN